MAVRLSALHIGRPLSSRKIPGTHFCWRLSRPQGHSAAGRIRSTEKCNNPACSIVPQQKMGKAIRVTGRGGRRVVRRRGYHIFLTIGSQMAVRLSQPYTPAALYPQEDCTNNIIGNT
jgi:hypothetical protein